MGKKPTYEELLDKIVRLERIISQEKFGDDQQEESEGSVETDKDISGQKNRWITRQRFNKAEQVARIGHWEIDLKTMTMFGSKGAATIYGLEENEISLEKAQKYPLSEYRSFLDKALDDLIKKGIPYNVEFQIRREKDQKILDIQSIAEYDRDRGVVFGIIQDITVKKETERKLRAGEQRYKRLSSQLQQTLNDLKETNRNLEKEKKKAQESDLLKSAFLANMSHEIRTPMNSILGFSELLTEENTPSSKRRKYADMVRQSGEQLMRLINDIIDISKIESNQLMIEKEWCNADELLEEILSRYRETTTNKPDLKLIFRKPDGQKKLFLFTDSFRLRQILDNLINNAVKFTERGSIEAGYRFPDKKNREVEFYVRDTGIGIPRESIQKIFIRFIRGENASRVRGTGLGLSISKGLADLLGGRITVESEAGKGSLFRFIHPIDAEIPEK